MTTCIELTKAEIQARTNSAANPRFAGGGTPPTDVEWVFARDGSLTARDDQGRWLFGCSLPRRAAMAQMKRLEVTGSVACFLAPPHASAIRIALDKLRAEQAIVVIVPDARDLDVLLACEDFSNDINAHRLWLAAGEDWAERLQQVLDDQPGLSVPTQFIRLNTADAAVVDDLIRAAQRVFSETTARRAQAVRGLRDAHREATACDQICVVAPRQFRLWNDWGNVLALALGDEANVAILNVDDPACASPLALASAASDRSALVTIDLGRADVPNVVSDSVRWVTWAVNRHIPRAGVPCDTIILLDPSDRARAREVGWNEAQIHVAQPPALRTAFVPIVHPCAIVADTLSLEPPASIDEFSSHRPLWEYVAEELTRNPFAIGHDVESYLTSRLRKLELDEQTLNRQVFAARLITPAYTQGVARLLIDAGFDLRLFGSGWDSDARFASRWHGVVQSRDHLAQIVHQTQTLVHAWPDRRRHPIDFTGRQVVHPFQYQTRAALLRAIRSPDPDVSHDLPAISARWLRSIPS